MTTTIHQLTSKPIDLICFMLSERLQKIWRRSWLGTGGAASRCSLHSGSRCEGGAGTSTYVREGDCVRGVVCCA